jgi:hypothetical protein
MLRTAARHLRQPVPKPVAAGLGLAARVPSTLARIPMRLPMLALEAALGVRAAYETCAREGAALLAEDDAQDGAEWPDPASMEPAPIDSVSDATPAGHQRSRFDDQDARSEPDAPHPDRATAPGNADTLPLDGFEALTVPQVRARLARLSIPDLETLRAHEATHQNRPPMLTMLDNRIAKLRRAP